MMRVFVFASLLTVCFAASLQTIEIEFHNISPANGTVFSPIWLAFHDGSYSPFDPSSPASVGMERLAEDGNLNVISNELLNEDNDALWEYLVADKRFISEIKPNQRAHNYFVIDREEHRYLNVMSMVLPSNDAFIGNYAAYQLFDDDDTFLERVIEWKGTDVWDAGTEVNDELPESTAFLNQTIPNTGTTEGGVITKHVGLKAPGQGGIVDQDQFANADFATEDLIARIAIRLIIDNPPLYMDLSELSPVEVETANGSSYLTVVPLFLVLLCL